MLEDGPLEIGFAYGANGAYRAPKFGTEALVKPRSVNSRGLRFTNPLLGIVYAIRWRALRSIKR